MINVSKGLYQEIEDSLEEYYRSNDCVYNRIYRDGKLMGYQGVIDNFDLNIVPDEQLGKLILKLISKGAGSNVPFNEEFYGEFILED